MFRSLFPFLFGESFKIAGRVVSEKQIYNEHLMLVEKIDNAEQGIESNQLIYAVCLPIDYAEKLITFLNVVLAPRGVLITVAKSTDKVTIIEIQLHLQSPEFKLCQKIVESVLRGHVTPLLGIRSRHFQGDFSMVTEAFTNKSFNQHLQRLASNVPSVINVMQYCYSGGGVSMNQQQLTIKDEITQVLANMLQFNVTMNGGVCVIDHDPETPNEMTLIVLN